MSTRSHPPNPPCRDMSSGHCCLRGRSSFAPPDACLGVPQPSPWAASSFPSADPDYHPAFIKYVFDSWLQATGGTRPPASCRLSSLHVCDEVGGTPSPAASCSPGGRERLMVRTLHPHPRRFLGAQVLSPRWGQVSSIGPSRRSRVLLVWELPWAGPGPSGSSDLGPNKAADCNGGAVWGFGFILLAH